MRLAPCSSVAMCSSGFSTSTPVASDTSAPVTSFGPWASSRVSIGSPDGTLTASFFRLRRTSTVSSRTPGMRAVESFMPAILTQVTAAPGMMESSVRRSEWPTVWAYPFSNGSATRRPYRSERISHWIVLGF